MKSSQYFIIIILCNIWKAQGHVRLTFPPARTYALDFLDNEHTTAPCGFSSSPASSRTSFVSGHEVNITWELAYPHKGGIALQIIEENPFQILHSFTNETFFFANDSTRQYMDVVLPINFSCSNCTIRLLQQAIHWGSDSIFWSCADVVIISADSSFPCRNISSKRRQRNKSEPSYNKTLVGRKLKPCPKKLFSSACYKGKCLNGGRCEKKSGNCSCLKLFSGDRCQYYDECWSDKDCNAGRCIDTRSTTHPRLLCYCELGWYGIGCDIKSEVVLEKDYHANPDYYAFVIKPDYFTVYWKFVNDQIEIVLQARTMSWIGIGWKPIDLDQSCQTFPKYTISFRKTHFVKGRTNYDQKKFEISPSVDPEEATENLAMANILSEHCNRTKLKLKNRFEITKLETDSPVETLTKIDAHPMDCSDIVVGSVKGSLHRVQDMYTRDRSTPRPDSFYQGSDDVTGAAGSQIDGVTTIAFRKKIEATHATDHSINRSREIFLIWAMGQQINNFFHSPRSELETCTASNYRFYHNDELKYHGTSSLSRGFLKFKFNEETKQIHQQLNKPGKYKELQQLAEQSDGSGEAAEDCESKTKFFSVPSECQRSLLDCEYYLEWKYLGKEDAIQFTFKFPFSQKKWFAVGFNDVYQMATSDVIMVWLNENNFPVVKDMHAIGYTIPQEDIDNNGKNDVYNVTGSITNNLSIITFKRKRITDDERDREFTYLNCWRMIYSYGSIISKKVLKHSKDPVLSRKRICIASCSDSQLSYLTYVGVANLLDAQYTSNLNKNLTLEYQRIKKQVSMALASGLSMISVPYLGRVDVEVTGFEAGSVLAYFSATASFDPNYNESAEILKVKMIEEFNKYLATTGGKLPLLSYHVAPIKMVNKNKISFIPDPKTLTAVGFFLFLAALVLALKMGKGIIKKENEKLERELRMELKKRESTTVKPVFKDVNVRELNKKIEAIKERRNRYSTNSYSNYSQYSVVAEDEKMAGYRKYYDDKTANSDDRAACYDAKKTDRLYGEKAGYYDDDKTAYYGDDKTAYYGKVTDDDKIVFNRDKAQKKNKAVQKVKTLSPLEEILMEAREKRMKLKKKTKKTKAKGRKLAPFTQKSKKRIKQANYDNVKLKDAWTSATRNAGSLSTISNENESTGKYGDSVTTLNESTSLYN